MRSIRREATRWWLIALAAASPVWMAAARAGDSWTRFRGENGSGHGGHLTLSATWTDHDANWKTELPGRGHSSPIVLGPRIFVQSAALDGTRQYLLCLSVHDGTLFWRQGYSAGPYQQHPRNSYASSTPAADAERVYAVFGSPEQCALRAFSHAGELLWEQPLGACYCPHGLAVSPIVFEEYVICALLHDGQPQDGSAPPQSSSVAAFRRKTGAEAWRVQMEDGKTSFSLPCIWRNQKGRAELICCSLANGMVSLDPETGARLWSLPIFAQRTVSSPVTAGKFVLATDGSGGGGNKLYAVAPGTTVREVFRIENQAPYVPTPLVREDLAFLWQDRGIVSCIELPAGRELWRERVGGSYSASPVCAGRRLFGVSDDGEVVELAAEREFQLVGRNQLGGPSRATPAIASGRIYFRTESHLISLGRGRVGVPEEAPES